MVDFHATANEVDGLNNIKLTPFCIPCITDGSSEATIVMIDELAKYPRDAQRAFD